MPDKPSHGPDDGTSAASASVDVWGIEPPPAFGPGERGPVAGAADEAAPERGPSTSHGSSRPRRHRAPRTDWRLGGRTVLRWREGLLAVALVSLGLGVVASTLLTQLWSSPWAAASAIAVIWLGMLVPLVWGFSRSRPIGLLRLRALDLLYGVVLGALLRTAQGWLAGVDGTPAPLPTLPRVDGRIPTATVLTDLVAPVVVAPLIEELFFHGVVLVALYTVLRRPFGKVAAGVCSVAGSTALFVIVHAIAGAVAVDGIVALSLLGLVCGVLVILTGRIWGAVLTHLVFNASFVLLAIAGSLLG